MGCQGSLGPVWSELLAGVISFFCSTTNDMKSAEEEEGIPVKNYWARSVHNKFYKNLGTESTFSYRLGHWTFVPIPAERFCFLLSDPYPLVHVMCFLFFLVFCILGVFFLAAKVLGFGGCVFCLSSRVFKGSQGEKNPWRFCGFPWCFRKDQGKEGQGVIRTSGFEAHANIRPGVSNSQHVIMTKTIPVT